MKVTPALAVIAAVAVGISGCTSHTSGKPPAQSTTPTTSTSSSSLPGSAPATTTPPPVVATTVPAVASSPVTSLPTTHSGIGQCGDNALDVSAADEQGATGHSSVVLRFHNTLSVPCTIFGYPGADAVTSTGAVLAHATRTLNGFAGGTHAITTVTVPAGGTVSALLEWMNFNPTTSGSCAQSAAIEVTPANTAHTVRLPVQVTVCVLQIHPTVGGTSGDA